MIKWLLNPITPPPEEYYDKLRELIRDNRNPKEIIDQIRQMDYSDEPLVLTGVEFYSLINNLKIFLTDQINTSIERGKIDALLAHMATMHHPTPAKQFQILLGPDIGARKGLFGLEAFVSSSVSIPYRLGVYTSVMATMLIIR